ncbi:MAG: nucleotidyltransferase domain-containing protein [Candidatus Odinarchaeota archaeon]
MKIIEGIEGDYLETKEDNLFFDVKGLTHPNNYKICFLRFFPHAEGERIRNNIRYKKVYDLSERFTILRDKFPKYLYFSKQLDLEVQGVDIKDIAKIYTPRDFYGKLLRENNLSTLEKDSKNLCDLFISEGNLNENSIGISGSAMIGLNTEDSDIDILIYGTELSLEFQKKLKNLFESTNRLRKYNIDEYKSHYNWRVGGSDISFQNFLKFEKRKQHQGKFGDYDFFIRYIKSPNDWNGNFYDYKYKNYGRIKLKAEIIDSKNSIFTPCSYKIDPQKIIERSVKSKNVKISEINEISSFRGRFCEQAQEGERVMVEGKLEKVNFKNTVKYYRILLTDQKKDKMLILD